VGRGNKCTVRINRILRDEKYCAMKITGAILIKSDELAHKKQVSNLKKANFYNIYGCMPLVATVIYTKCILLHEYLVLHKSYRYKLILF